MIRVEIDTKQARKVLSERMRATLPACRKALEEWADAALQIHKVHRMSGPPGVTRHTGNLEKSMKRTKAQGRTLSDLRLVLYSARKTAVYGRLHEGVAGGNTTVTPKLRNFLAFPVRGGPAMGADGRSKYKGPLFTTLPKSMGFRKYCSLTGNWYLKDKYGRNWYHLKRSVVVKPRLKFAATLQGYAWSLRERAQFALRRLWSMGVRV